MVVCQFFLQNRCKFGDGCRFEHPRGGTQRNLFNGPSQPWQGGGSGGSNNWQGGGSGGSNNWQGGSSGGSNNWQGSGSGGNNNWQGGGSGGGNNWQGGGSGQRVTFKDSFGTSGQASGSQYKWTANQQSPHGPQGSDNFQQSTLDLVNSLPKEMDVWEKSHMWPFSCFALDKDMPSLPEFNDVCPEELRLEAYQAMKSGNMQPYTQKIQSLQNEFQGKRRQLQHMTVDLKSKLIAVIDEARKKKPSQPASVSSSAFGSSQTSQNVFGQAQATASTGLFGKSIGAADSNSSNLFGKSTAGSVFGGNFSPRSDNNPSSFSSSGASLFGKPVTAGSVFGNQPQEQASPAPKPFGLVNDNNTPQTSGLFGQTANSVPQTNSLFRNSAVNQPPSLFGGSQPSSLFGGSAASPSPGLFGKSFTQQTPNASFPVGSGTPAAQPTSFFATPLSQNQPSASLFGKPNPDNVSATSSVFGGAASNQGQASKDVSAPSHGSSIGATTSVSTTSHGRYTPLADLTDQEKEAFSAKMFTLGKIPLRPPPREMVN